ncbi:MAG: zinc-dependent alcohol dehydrogenase [Candidatus Limnocylindria bacterium]
MRAVRIVGPGAVEVVELPDPTPAADEVVVEVAFAAVCSTDRKLVRRGEPVGRIPGHEISGRLDDGTLVGVHPDTGCGRCRKCDAGQTNRCARRRSVGIDRDGGFAEKVVVPAAHVIPVVGLPAELVPLLEPLACALHAAARLRVEPGESAVVVGGGAMGILAMWALQARGLRVFVRQRSPQRRRQAQDLGATGVIEASDGASVVMDMQPDVVVVTAPGSEPLAWALAHVAEGGRVHVFAGSPDGAPVDANMVHYRHLDLVGSTGSGLVDYAAALELARSGVIDLARLPRTDIGLEDLPSAVATSGVGPALRTVVRLRSQAA